MTDRNIPPHLRGAMKYRGPIRPQAGGPQVQSESPNPAPAPNPQPKPPIAIRPSLPAEPLAAVTPEIKLTKGSLPKWWFIAAAITIIGGLAATHYFYVEKPNSDFTEEWVTISIIRNLPEIALIPDWDTEMIPEKIKLVTKNGYGLRLELIAREDGKQKSKTYEALIPPKPAPKPAEQNRQLAKAREKFPERVAKFNTLFDRVVKYAVFVDSTSGDLSVLRKQLELQLGPQMVERTTKKGYGVRIYFHQLSSTPSFTQNFLGTVDIQPKASNGAGQQEIADKRDNITADLKGAGASALVMGLFNAIDEDGLTAGDHVLVFSDGLEHYRSTFSLESGQWSKSAFLADENNWPSIFGKMEKSVPNMPTLAGISFDWFLPLREDKVETMTQAIKIWKKFIQIRKGIFREHL